MRGEGQRPGEVDDPFSYLRGCALSNSHLSENTFHGITATVPELASRTKRLPAVSSETKKGRGRIKCGTNYGRFMKRLLKLYYQILQTTVMSSNFVRIRTDKKTVVVNVHPSQLDHSSENIFSAVAFASFREYFFGVPFFGQK